MATTDSYGALIDKLRHLFASVVEKLPHGSVRLDEYQSGENWSIELIPSEPHAARAGVHVDRSELVDFCFGPCTWELPYESRDPKNIDHEALVARTSEMLDAIVSGRCEETHSLLGTTATIYLPSGPTRVTETFTGSSLLARTIRYEPYA